ncbi:MAG TPA: flippase [Synechococcales cyanobacterium M55_K2018_004]|nr:flippase [Synechococcales cyanobacterium M55_K2018_004]
MLTRLSNRLNSEHRKIIGNTGWLFIGRIFRILISLLVSTWVARYLGPKEFGILQYALAFSSFFLPLSTIQMAPIVTRDLVRQPESSNVILGTAFTLQLVGGAIAAIASITLIFVVSPEDFLVHLLVAIVALKFIFNSLQPIESWFEARVESKFKVLAENVAFIFSTVLKCYLILSGASVVALTIVLVLETLLYSFGLIFYYQKSRQSVLNWRTNWKKIQYFIRESFPLVLSSTTVLIYINIDRVMLGNMVGKEAVGIYSSAATLSESWWFLESIVSSSLYPMIIQSRDLGKAVYDRRLQKYYDLISLMAYGLILVMIPSASLVITILYGKAYQAAIPILIVHICSALFSFLGAAQSHWIVNEGLQKFNLYSRLAGLVSNILLNLLLIPLYGGMGAAIATIISYAIGGYLFYLVIPVTRENAVRMTKALLLPIRLPKVIQEFIR